jgi:hypothetical protein
VLQGGDRMAIRDSAGSTCWCVLLLCVRCLVHASWGMWGLWDRLVLVASGVVHNTCVTAALCWVSWW